MSWANLARILVLALCIMLAACMPNSKQIRTAVSAAQLRQETALSCTRADRCALDSPLRALGEAAFGESTPAVPRHRVLLLERGQDALLARVHLIRAAQRSIEMQSFFFVEDDAGYLVLDELLHAAHRGVKVRVLLDQLFSVDDVQLLARLAQAHQNFELRLYNPTFGEAHTNPVQFAAGIVCCFFRFNQRMHNKLLLVDGLVGITGGRNYQNRYYDWDGKFNYRDRDVLAAGPVAAQMQASFEAFWSHRKSVPVAALHDVRRWIGARTERSEPLLTANLTRAERMLDLSAQADNALLIEQRLVRQALAVGRVGYLSDLPNKRFGSKSAIERDLSLSLQALLRGAERRIVLQTPYLVFSRAAQNVFRDLQTYAEPPKIIVSTNSLASTDAFYVYALSHKYKRRYLREFGFNIYEYKPFPANAPIDLADTGAVDGTHALDDYVTESRRAFGYGSGATGSQGYSRGPLPLRHAGLRLGLHAKSMVIDDDIAMIGSHNFDPRSDWLNTEGVLIVYDVAFAAQLAQQILRDTAPGNAWTIARRPKPPLLSGVHYSLSKVFEALPLFDVWPFRYATSYELKPDCEPLPLDDPDFHRCYEPVGDFPEVEVPLKSIYTRVLTAFGAGLAPIL